MNYEREIVDIPNNQNARVYHLYLSQQHYMKQHFHHNVELVYVLKGHFIAHVGSHSYNVTSDSLFLINANEIHYFEIHKDSEMITVLLYNDSVK